MRILVLAPQPFFQERGTPIAVKLAVEHLAQRLQSRDEDPAITLLVYSEGEEIAIPGVKIVRARYPRFLYGVKPGISCKKLVVDLFFFVAFARLLMMRGKKFNLIHAVEESVFMAWAARIVTRIPYVYDMDSCLSQQLVESWRIARIFAPILRFLERTVIRGSIATAAVCEALEEVARSSGAPRVGLLRDISLLHSDETGSGVLRRELGLTGEDVLVTYVGNLEAYQGVELLVDSFRVAARDCPKLHLAIIGGKTQQGCLLKERLDDAELSRRLHILGARPVRDLGVYLRDSDILAAPRIHGSNTPMKIYSYLHAGKAILATRLPTHTQVLNDQVSHLVAPAIEQFASGLAYLYLNADLRRDLGQRAFLYAEQEFTRDAFCRSIDRIYTEVEQVVSGKMVSVPLVG